jgi:hypothetical protein
MATLISTNQIRRLLLIGVTVGAVALALGIGMGIATASDPRLAEADAALQKAGALLAASQAGVVDPKTQRRFDQAMARAIADVQDARAAIAEAIDNPVTSASVKLNDRHGCSLGLARGRVASRAARWVPGSVVFFARRVAVRAPDGKWGR